MRPPELPGGKAWTPVILAGHSTPGFNEAAGITRRKAVVGVGQELAAVSGFNEAAGITRRKADWPSLSVNLFLMLQ